MGDKITELRWQIIHLNALAQSRTLPIADKRKYERALREATIELAMLGGGDGR